jgi:ribose transport system substrate-binding protein
MKRTWFVLFLGLVVVIGLGAEPGKWRIAFSNNYAANSWRQQMLRDWQTGVDKAKADGQIAEAQAFTTNENSAAEQAAQIQNMILEGYDAIVIDAASPTALNGAVNLAAAAGIPVVCFDGIVTSPKAYVINIDFGWYGRNQVEYIANNLTKTGNILEIRGLPGTSVNDDIHNGIAAGLKKYPGLKVVGEVYGNWDEATAQKAVAGILPSLPKIDAVVDQGGDGYGAIMAFQAAGRNVPMVMMGNRYDELAIWKELKDKSGFKTFSACSQPGAVQIAMWVAVEVLNGKKVPHMMNINPLVVPQEKLDFFLANTAKGGVATLNYPQAWTQQMIANVIAGKPAPADPIGQ